MKTSIGIAINELGSKLPILFASTTSTLALSLFFTSATAASGTVTDVDGTGNALTFTRASVAKYWNASGVLSEAASGIARVGASNRKPVTNLLTYPEQFDNAVWNKDACSVSPGQADPFGGTNASKLVENTANTAHNLRLQGFSYGTITYTVSAYVKAGERNWIRLYSASGGPSVYFNVSTGEVGTVGGFEGYGIARVEGAAGWYRVWATKSSAAIAAGAIRIYLADADNSPTYLGDGSSGLFIFGAMLNEGGIEDYIGAYNLLTDDKDFTAATWTTFAANETTAANTAVAPDGTTTADTFGDDSGGGTGSVSIQLLTASTTFRGAGTYTFSVFAKAKQLSDIALRTLSFTGGINDISYFDLSGGTVAQAGSIFLDSSISYWGNDWYHCSVTFSVIASDLVGGLYVLLDEGSQNTSLTNRDGTSDVYLWGAQLTKGSTLYPYVGMPQTGFVEVGYTAEAAATNLVTDSEDFSAAAWTINNTDSLTVTANSIAAPDGTTTMDLIDITDTADETHLISDSITITSATDYAISCFAKANEHRYVGINLYISSENFATVVYDLLTGTVAATDVGTTSGTVTASGVVSTDDGNYRIWASLRVTGTAATIGLAAYNSASPTFDDAGLEAFAGTAGNGFYAWGMQVETGTYPSSYMKTSGGTFTRAADDLSETGLAYFNADEGTLIVEGGYTNGNTTQDFAGFTDNSNSDIIGFVASPIVRATASNTFEPSGPNAAQAASIRQAMAYKANDANHAYNGTAGTTDTSVTLPTNISVLELASMNFQGPFQQKNIKSLEYYSERKSDADLATLSTITDDGTSWRDEQSA